MTKEEKLAILGEAARYDASCSSSGSTRKNSGGTGNASYSGICHSWADDGRCISLLKVLVSNACTFDCAYCSNRRSNDIPRATFTPEEIADITINFYKRNYIEGLFLSSAVVRNVDYSMELLNKTARLLRNEHNFHGYIHMKVMPGAQESLIREAGMYADRVSANIELPTAQSLTYLAPDKTKTAVMGSIHQISRNIRDTQDARRVYRNAPVFAPAGQSTQMIVGATPDTDRTIMTLAESLYTKLSLKRVYYSAYIPVSTDNRLPMLSAPPLLHEHRLYQADWLLRFYGFTAHELLDEARPNFDLDLDPKVHWALRNYHFFPVDINSAPYEAILRVPGIGVRSALKIVSARKYTAITFEHLKKLGVVLKRAKYFITAGGRSMCREIYPEAISADLLREGATSIPRRELSAGQLPLFNTGRVLLPAELSGEL